MSVTISCSRNFPVKLNGKDVGKCGSSLNIKVGRGGVLEIIPDLQYLTPDGKPTGGTSKGTAKISYNGTTTTKTISGNGVQYIINW